MAMLVSVLIFMRSLARWLGLPHEDEVAILLCGSQKSLVSAASIAGVLFGPAVVGQVLLPIMVYYPVQLVICAWLARRYAAEATGRHNQRLLLVPQTT